MSHFPHQQPSPRQKRQLPVVSIDHLRAMIRPDQLSDENVPKTGLVQVSNVGELFDLDENHPLSQAPALPRENQEAREPQEPSQVGWRVVSSPDCSPSPVNEQGMYYQEAGVMQSLHNDILRAEEAKVLEEIENSISQAEETEYLDWMGASIRASEQQTLPNSTLETSTNAETQLAPDADGSSDMELSDNEGHQDDKERSLTQITPPVPTTAVNRGSRAFQPVARRVSQYESASSTAVSTATPSTRAFSIEVSSSVGFWREEITGGVIVAAILEAIGGVEVIEAKGILVSFGG